LLTLGIFVMLMRASLLKNVSIPATIIEGIWCDLLHFRFIRGFDT
jgi:hypothetical protein